MLTVKTKKANDDNDNQEKEGNDDNDDEVAVEEEAAWLEACHKTNYRGPALYTHHTMHCNAMYVKTYTQNNHTIPFTHILGLFSTHITM